MTETTRFGVLLFLLLIAGVLVAGCSSQSDTTPTPTPTTLPVAKYAAGDIVAKTSSGNEDHLYVILGYDPTTDMYSRAWIYRNSDGSWGHFIDSKTDKGDRATVEKVYPVTVAHVSVSAIPVVTPTVAVVANITYVGGGPSIANITPTTGVMGGSATITISGANFQTGATTKLIQAGSGSVTGSATSVSSSSISTTFNLAQLGSGKYNVMVINPDGRSDTLVNAFTVGEAFPVVNSITPNTAEMNDTIDAFTINGQNFKTSGATVNLVKGSNQIACVNVVVVDATKITCGPISFRATNLASTGSWNVQVMNIDGQQSGTGNQLFTVTNATST